jgi:hypothetical protein
MTGLCERCLASGIARYRGYRAPIRFVCTTLIATARRDTLRHVLKAFLSLSKSDSNKIIDNNLRFDCQAIEEFGGCTVSALSARSLKLSNARKGGSDG